MNNNPIGIFDSGIGGLTVLKKIIQVLPNEKYIYYADIDNVPYGTKPKEDVKKLSGEAISSIMTYEKEEHFLSELTTLLSSFLVIIVFFNLL